MFRKTSPLQSKSEILLRNITVTGMILFYTVFLLVPIGIAFAGSFHEWNPLSGIYRFNGIENYVSVFTSALFGKSMLNTLIFSVVVIFFRVGLGLAIAIAIYSNLIKHKSFFRAIYYMPVVTPMVAVAFVWKFLYNPQIGAINQILGLDINWLMNPKTALLAIMIMTIWKDFGYAVVMFMAGLYSLPSDAMEAARVDGASSWQTFKYLTLPLLKPMTLFVVITSIISYIQAYVQVLILTEGGPGTATYLSSYIIYNEETEYYYLFVSYGSLKTDYQIRVGRSKKVTGPYVDYNGREMTDTEDPHNEVGYMAYCGYQWSHGVGYMAPGHNSVLHDKDGNWYLVNHIRQKEYIGDWLEPSTMQIRKMYWSESGWPVVAPEPYAGEIVQDIPLEKVLGKYERITLTKTLPQGIQTGVPMKLDRGCYGDYYECCSIQGTWKYEGHKLTISYGPHTEEAFVTAVWDAERNCQTIGICGISEDGVPFWAKRISDLKQG